VLLGLESWREQVRRLYPYRWWLVVSLVGLAISSTNSVWFVQEDERLYLLPVGGADSDWYRNVLKAPTIRLGASGLEASADATPITDTAIVNDIVDKFRAKYGSNVGRYYPKHDVAVEVPLA